MKKLKLSDKNHTVVFVHLVRQMPRWLLFLCMGPAVYNEHCQNDKKTEPHLAHHPWVTRILHLQKGLLWHKKDLKVHQLQSPKSQFLVLEKSWHTKLQWMEKQKLTEAHQYQLARPNNLETFRELIERKETISLDPYNWIENYITELRCTHDHGTACA